MLPADLVGGTATILQGLNLDPRSIEEILSTLRESSGVLETPMGETDTAPMEGCAGGENFAHHAGLAREHMVQGFKEMVQAFQGLDSVVRDYADVQGDNDLETARALNLRRARLDAVADCFTGPTEGTQSACVPGDMYGED